MDLFNCYILNNNKINISVLYSLFILQCNKIIATLTVFMDYLLFKKFIHSCFGYYYFFILEYNRIVLYRIAKLYLLICYN